MTSRILFLTLAFSLLLTVQPEASQQPVAAQDAVTGMSLIPAGDFWMGRVHLWDRDLLDVTETARFDDRPAHLVYLDAYYIDKYEVTNEDYQVFTGAANHTKPYHWKDGKIPAGKEKWPVYNVNWSDAQAYCAWKGKRLPTEAEWEKAARGGLDRKLYPWGDTLEVQQPDAEGKKGKEVKMAQYDSAYGPSPVGSFPPNGFDLYDMTGNVHEWIADWYEREYYSTTSLRNPTGPETGLYRVFRGGSWADADTTSDRVLGAHYRNFTDPSTRTVTIGVRCVQTR